MTATVLLFARPCGGGSRQKAENIRAASEIERRSFVREVREALSVRSGKAKLQRKLRRDEDAILLARRLGADLERLKKRERGALSKTLDQAGLKLTTRARYALFPDDDISEKRIRKLQPYVSLSDAIAGALHQDVDLFLYEMLDGINLVEAETPEDDEAAKLSLLLDQMAKAVAERTGLCAFFDTAARTPGTMDEWGRFQSSTMTILRDRKHEGGFDHWSEQQPIPSVPICRILEQTLYGQARIARWSKQDPEKLPELLEAVDGASARKAVEISIEVWREIGLAIGERYQQGAIGAMFSGRAHIRVKVDGVVVTPFYPWTLEHFFLDTPVLLVDGDRWTACRASLELNDEFSDAWVEPIPVPGTPSYAVEHYYFSKHPVNPWNLRRLLDRSEHDDPEAESLLPEMNPETRLSVYRFGGAIGQRFEAALFSGDLESALIADVDRLKNELDRYLSERREMFAAQDEEMMTRWRTFEHQGAERQEKD